MTTEPGAKHLLALICAGVLGWGLACSDDGGGNDDEQGEGMACMPGEVVDCACTDGSSSTQVCEDDGSGYGACACDGGETSDSGESSGSTDGTDGSTDGSDTDTSGSESSTDTSGTTDTSTDTGALGEDPVPEIWHPSDGEDRQVGVAIPWIGAATDAEDGDLSGAALVWTSDLDGEFGTGEMFDAALETLGTHTITLTATDSDQQQGAATIEINVVP